MKTFSAALVVSMAASTAAFAPAATSKVGSALKGEKEAMPDRLWDSMVVKDERSKSVPYLPRAKALDGTLPGDYGFDPFFLSSIPKNFAGFIQPPSWEATEGISTIYWMQEAELKHGRVAMLAVTGWIATDQGMRFPFPQYSIDAIPTGYNAHDLLVDQGTMTVLLLAVGFVEFCSGAVLVEVSKGESDRAAGDFGFGSKYLKKDVHTMKTKEVNNGRLAMLAFSGIATQTALGATEFPYITIA